MAIQTRAGKGSALTWAEVDNNFTELDSKGIKIYSGSKTYKKDEIVYLDVDTYRFLFQSTLDGNVNHTPSAETPVSQWKVLNPKNDLGFDSVPNWPLPPFITDQFPNLHYFEWTPAPTEPGNFDLFEYRLYNAYDWSENGRTEWRNFTSGNTSNVTVTYGNSDGETITVAGFRTTDAQYSVESIPNVESWTGVGIRRKATSTVEAGQETALGIL